MAWRGYGGTPQYSGINYGRAPQAPAATGSSALAEGFGALAKSLAQRQSKQELERRQAVNYWRQNTKHIPQKKLAEFEGAYDANMGADERSRNDPNYIYSRTQHAIKQWDDTQIQAKAEQKRLKDEADAAEAMQKKADRQAADLRKLVGKGQAESVAEQARIAKDRARYEERLAKHRAGYAKAQRAAAA